jgi:Heparinase II/III-like protein/Domain of unknown function (DUF4962)
MWRLLFRKVTLLTKFRYFACAMAVAVCTTAPAWCTDTDSSLSPAMVKTLGGMDEAHRLAARDWLDQLHHAATTDDGENLLLTLRPQHPRLMLLDSDVEQVHNTIAHDSIAQALWESVQRRATKILAEPLATAKSGETDQLELSRLVLKRVYTLAGTYRLSHDKRFLERARAEMLQAAALKTWDPAHFLDVAEMTNALAIGYDWLYNDLSQPDRQTIRDAIVRLGLNEGIKAYQSHQWWTAAKNNWNPVCNGGMVAGALAIADEEPKLANRILKCMRISLPRAMVSFAPDGGWAEGPGYWNYCTRYVAYLCADLKAALGTDFEYTKTDGLSQTGYFEIYCCGPIDKSFNFADATEEVEKAWQMMWLSRTFANTLFAGQELLIGRDGPDIFHLLYFAKGEVTKTAATEGLPLDALFKGVNVAFLRSSWTDPKAFFIGFKGGDNQANHSHLDLGTFVLDGAGCRWALDLGPDDYQLPGYFGKERYNYYRLRTEGHNCITIDKQNQSARAKAPITSFSKDAKFAFAVADLSDGYKDKLTSVRRGIGLRDGRVVLIQDEIDAPKAVPIVWHWHTKAIVNLSSDGSTATLEQQGPNGKELLHMRILAPAGAKFTTQTSVAPLPQAQQKDVTDLNIALNLPTGQSTIAVLVAQDQTASAPIIPLSFWAQALNK